MNHNRREMHRNLDRLASVLGACIVLALACVAGWNIAGWWGIVTSPVLTAVVVGLFWAGGND